MPISRRLFLFSFCFFRRIKTSIFIAVVATFLATSSSPTYTHTHTHTRTTKMPSDEQQLAEPLLDDGGNDRFVLFPLKYDAVWEMVRLSYDIISSIFKNLSVFEAFEICACADVLSSLSLSLSLFLLSITVQESASVVLDRWYVLLLLLVRSCLCSSLVLLLLCSRFGHFKN